VVENGRKFHIKEGAELHMLCSQNTEKELTYLLAKEFENSWNVSDEIVVIVFFLGYQVTAAKERNTSKRD